MSKFKSSFVSIVVLTLMTISALAQNQNTSPQPQPDAKELLKKVSEVHQNLKSFQFEGQTVLEMKGDGVFMRFELPFVLASGKAGQRRIQTKNPFEGGRTIVSDGQTEWVYLVSEKQFTKKLFDKASLPEAGAPLLNQFKSHSMFADLTSEDLTQNLASAKVLREETLELGGQHINCYVIEAVYSDTNRNPATSNAGAHGNAVEQGKTFTYPMTFWIDKERLIVLRHQFDGGGVFAQMFKAFADNANFTMSTTLTVAKTNEPLPDSFFAFAPPADAKEVEKFDSKFAGAADEDEPETESLVGSDAVSFSLADLNGKQFSMGKLRGKIVVIDFWASWCGPCRETMPHVEKLHKDFKDKGVIVIGINDEEIADAKRFVQKYGYTFPTLMDAEGSVSKQYGIQAIPQTFVIDRDGKIAAHFLGTGQEENLRQTVKELLAVKAVNAAKPAKKQIAVR
ncbi:MAG: redoxin domain-containing protein [Acidobacteria bacterium]|nr:redoxin domain-containing protein [Acidobacteriota bacterium]